VFPVEGTALSHERGANDVCIGYFHRCSLKADKTSCARGRIIFSALVRRTLRPSSSPYTPYACSAQRALLPVAVGAINIHDVRDRQTSSDRQTSDTHHFIMPPGRRHNKRKGQGKLNMHVIFLKCADVVCHYQNWSALVETTPCRIWHVFIDIQRIYSQYERIILLDRDREWETVYGKECVR